MFWSVLFQVFVLMVLSGGSFWYFIVVFDKWLSGGCMEVVVVSGFVVAVE